MRSKIKAFLLQVLATAFLLINIYIGFWYLAVDRYDPKTGIWYDGFGRTLQDSGLLGGRSAGFLWDAFDFVIAILSISLIVFIFKLSNKYRQLSQEEQNNLST